MGRGDLPDMYARARGRAAPECECGHIRQITTAHVTYTSGHYLVMGDISILYRYRSNSSSIENIDIFRFYLIFRYDMLT